jgi:hypothetical protein
MAVSGHATLMSKKHSKPRVMAWKWIGASDVEAGQGARRLFFGLLPSRSKM